MASPYGNAYAPPQQQQQQQQYSYSQPAASGPQAGAAPSSSSSSSAANLNYYNSNFTAQPYPSGGGGNSNGGGNAYYSNVQQQQQQQPQGGYGLGRINTPDLLRATNTATGNGNAGGGSGGGARAFRSNVLGSGGFVDEPSLLEELEINIPHIRTKTLTVLNPLRTPDAHIMDDTDLAGPIFFWALFGLTLMLAGKVHFSYVYGIAMCGVLGVYWMLNLMAEGGIELMRTTSVLGYCMLPMVMSSMLSILPFMTSFMNMVSAMLSITWCTYSAALLFTTVLSMRGQRFLVAYPVGLVYACFALMTLF